MKNKYFTLLILRHAGPRFRKLRLSYPFAVVAAAIVFVLGASGLYVPHLLSRVQEQAVTVDRLAQENTVLRLERDTFEGALDEVSRQLGDFEARAGRLAEELGVKDLPSAEGGAGGPGEVTMTASRRYWFESEINGLQTRTRGLSRSFGQLDEVFVKRANQLAATPHGMPVEGWFSHGFGWREDPFTGKREFHRGIDIVAPQGTDVQASADGVVARANRSPDLGKVLEIAHGYGYVTRYAHLNELLVERGERVTHGDLIGRVGSTGRSTGPHVHYEVFRDGRRVNPWQYLDR
jgi:murein DD-endopeptidase MepM/ murein hydrolase activator NlpD